ncbi:hypothetical protein NUW58_g4377 [Xylaria curta]|uniref:Uncharacterized protein n=2 Tax=Xylaria curta TaxID=42375 RepID=A0ACC1P735_9PEZI|nr:hypothetical protein NUW58_g6498 [Xylaria curta]KAJ2987667.1 hypothetical protein NUW58_g4377 [Xylaria curta]
MATLPPTTKIEEEEWDRHKDTIISLYLGTSHGEGICDIEGENWSRGMTLGELVESMKRRGLTASASQFETKLKSWGTRKNLKPEEWEPIHERLDALPRATKSRVLISGRVVMDTKIERARRYRKKMSRVTSSTRGFSKLSTIPHYVNIEVQQPGGGWMQLPNSIAMPAPKSTNTSVHSTITGVLGERQMVELSVPDPGPAEVTAPGFSVWNGYSAFDAGGFPYGSCRGYPVDCPSTWLDELPIRQIIKDLRVYRPDDIGLIKNARQIEDRSIGIMDLDNPTLQHSGIDDAGLGTTDALVAAQYVPKQAERNQRIMAPADARRLNFGQILLSAIIDGTGFPENIPEEVLDGILTPSGRINSLLLRFLKDAACLSGLLVSSLFRALMIQDKLCTISQLLKNGLIDINDTIIVIGDKFGPFSDQPRQWLTPLEYAARIGTEELVELLLSYRADPNRSYSRGERFSKRSGPLVWVIRRLIESERSFCQHSSGIICKLVEAGAKPHPVVVKQLSGTDGVRQVLDEATASYIFPHLDQSRHREYFENEFWNQILPRGDDIHAAALVNRFVSDCAERHNSRCISRHQQDVNSALLLAAARGRLNTFLAISPHSIDGGSGFDENLLSAAIKGNQSEIISSAMKRRPNINAPAYAPNPDKTFLGTNSTPLAEAILIDNSEFLNCFVDADVFKWLNTADRLSVALAAAVEIGNINLVTRLLNSCPDLELQDMRHALYQAIVDGNETVATMLLGKGASIYRGSPFYSTSFGQDPFRYWGSATILAFTKGNREIIRNLMSIGEASSDWTRDAATQLALLCLVDSDLTEDYLSSFYCGFRYWIGTIMTKVDEFDPARTPKTDRPCISDYLVPALQSRKTQRLILGSKLATVRFLTVCLATAVSQKNLALVQELIDGGADASDDVVWKCALRRGTSSIPLLFDGMNRPRRVVTKGLRTDLLKEAIAQGPSSQKLVFQLIGSGLVDIFDTGDVDNDGDEALTPLGMAIDAAEDESSRRFSYDTVKLLLDHDCDPNGIVSFDTSDQSAVNQTAMLRAIDVGSQELVKLLIERGARVNVELRHRVRSTPLQEAAANGDLEMVRLLLQHGADVNAKPCIALGGTALQFAAISGNCDVACELLKHGASLYMPPSKIGGRWPIEGAAEHGRYEMIQFLWKANERTLFPHFDENGFREKNLKKAMRLARDQCHQECVKLIAGLANLPDTATDVPREDPPICIDWPPLRQPANGVPPAQTL